MAEQKQMGTLLVTDAGVVLRDGGLSHRSLPFGSELAVKWGMHWLTGTIAVYLNRSVIPVWALENRGDYVGLITGMQAWVSESPQEEWVRLIEEKINSDL